MRCSRSSTGVVDVPVDERVAYLDNDGTMWCEKPTYVQLDFFVDALQQRRVESIPRWRSARSSRRCCSGDMAKIGEIGLVQVAGALAALFDGQTPEEFGAAVDDFLGRYPPSHARVRGSRASSTNRCSSCSTSCAASTSRSASSPAAAPSSSGGSSRRLYGVEPGMVVGTLIGYRFDRDDAGRPVVRRTAAQTGSGQRGRRQDRAHPLPGRARTAPGGRQLRAATARCSSGPRHTRSAASAVLVDHDDAEREFAYESTAATFEDAEPITDGRRAPWLGRRQHAERLGRRLRHLLSRRPRPGGRAVPVRSRTRKPVFPVVLSGVLALRESTR